MIYVTLREAGSQSGGYVSRELKKLDGGVRAKIAGKLKDMATRPREDWKRPFYDQLTGHQLGEIILKIGKAQYRIYGYFRTDPKGRPTYVMLSLAKKDSKSKKQKTNPPNAIDTAETRRKKIENGELQDILFSPVGGP